MSPQATWLGAMGHAMPETGCWSKQLDMRDEACSSDLVTCRC